MEYARVRPKSASKLPKYRRVLLAVVAVVAVALGAAACGPSSHPQKHHHTMGPAGY